MFAILSPFTKPSCRHRSNHRPISPQRSSFYSFSPLPSFLRSWKQQAPPWHKSYRERGGGGSSFPPFLRSSYDPGGGGGGGGQVVAERSRILVFSPSTYLPSPSYTISSPLLRLPTCGDGGASSSSSSSSSFSSCPEGGGGKAREGVSLPGTISSVPPPPLPPLLFSPFLPSFLGRPLPPAKEGSLPSYAETSGSISSPSKGEEKKRFSPREKVRREIVFVRLKLSALTPFPAAPRRRRRRSIFFLEMKGEVPNTPFYHHGMKFFVRADVA